MQTHIYVFFRRFSSFSLPFLLNWCNIICFSSIIYLFHYYFFCAIIHLPSYWNCLAFCLLILYVRNARLPNALYCSNLYRCCSHYCVCATTLLFRYIYLLSFISLYLHVYSIVIKQGVAKICPPFKIPTIYPLGGMYYFNIYFNKSHQYFVNPFSQSYLKWNYSQIFQSITKSIYIY